jgi:hypothetical protein
VEWGPCACPGHIVAPARRTGTRPNTFQIRRFASQTKPMQACHRERSEGSLAGLGSFAALTMTKRDGLVFEMYWAQAPTTSPFHPLSYATEAPFLLNLTCVRRPGLLPGTMSSQILKIAKQGGVVKVTPPSGLQGSKHLIHQRSHWQRHPLHTAQF